MVRRGRGSVLHGLDQRAVDFVYAVQPLHQTRPAEDPLVILNKLDNADKHRLLHHAFVYPGVDCGTDLIEIRDSAKVRHSENLWDASQPLENGTNLARFMIRGEGGRAIRARSDAKIGFASGEFGSPRTGYTDMIARVRAIADRAAALIES